MYLNLWHICMQSYLACVWLCNSGLYLSHWHGFTKFYPGSGCASPGLYLIHWHFFCAISSRMWVAVHLGSIWTSNIPSMQSHSGCEWLCTSRAPFEHLIFFLCNLIQDVSGCAPPGLYLIHWHASMKSHQVCKWLYTSRALFELLICFYWILSRK